MTSDEYEGFRQQIYHLYPSLLEWIKRVSPDEQFERDCYKSWYQYVRDLELAECKEALDHFTQCTTSPFEGFRNDQFMLVVRSCVMGQRMRQNKCPMKLKDFIYPPDSMNFAEASDMLKAQGMRNEDRINYLITRSEINAATKRSDARRASNQPVQ